MAPLPWCAALKCPAQQDCEGYISSNQGSETARSFVACCKILCGRSANDKLLALECGGATPATAVGTIIYLLVLLSIGAYIIAVGPFRCAKSVTFIFVACGYLVFNTGTGVFVTNVTSPFRVLPSLPAVGAMNVAVFFYFFSGFQYAVGPAYEGAPLFVFITTAYTVLKEISFEQQGPMLHANRIACTMLVVAGIWILHSISYRLYGYRVDWRLEFYRYSNSKKPEGPAPRSTELQGLELEKDGGRLNPNFHLGAAQGQPTWRTPVGQSASVVLTALAWAVSALTERDLANRRCRPDWVFSVMLYGAPCLISLTIVWNVLSATRRRTIRNVGTSSAAPSGFLDALRNWLKLSRPEKIPRPVEADYHGFRAYRILWANRTKIKKWSKVLQEEYVRAVASQRMGRNGVFAEHIPDERLRWTDKFVGFVAWLLAQLALLLSFPVVICLMAVTELLGFCFQCCGCTKLVETVVDEGDKASLAEEVDRCYVGRNLPRTAPDYKAIRELKIVGEDEGRSCNLHTLLDNTGPAELYSFLYEEENERRQ